MNGECLLYTFYLYVSHSEYICLLPSIVMKGLETIKANICKEIGNTKQILRQSSWWGGTHHAYARTSTTGSNPVFTNFPRCII